MRDNIVSTQGVELKPSNNDYDWLGGGVYFWENNLSRAYSFAKYLSENPPHNKKQRITEPAVLGAVLELGHCLDLLDAEYLDVLKAGFRHLKQAHAEYGQEIPKNVSLVSDGDLLKRFLDCAVIETIHELNTITNSAEFDSVRGVFFEGKELYKNAGFREKNHIQIAIRNPNCIKGYFIPRELNTKYAKV